MVQYNVSKGTNPAYMLFLSCPTANLELIADLPEQTVLAIQSDWENRMGKSILPDVVTSLTGISPLSQEWNTRQMWTSTSPLEFSFTILFDALTSAYKDVFLPMMSVVQLAAPESYGDILLPPGPSRVDKTRNAVTMGIGKMIRITDAILVSAQATFDNRMAADNYPIAGELEVTIRTSVVYSRNDIARIVANAGNRQ